MDSTVTLGRDHAFRKSGPISFGADPPSRFDPWQDAHCLVNNERPCIAWTVVYVLASGSTDCAITTELSVMEVMIPSKIDPQT